SSSLQRTVTVDFRNTTLEIALQEVARRAGLELSYVSSMVPRDARVTYKQSNAAVGSVFQALLHGTGLVVVSTGDAKVNLVRGSASARQEQGIVAGIVVNGKTKQP